jgi:hypothetical protein
MRGSLRLIEVHLGGQLRVNEADKHRSAYPPGGEAGFGMSLNIREIGTSFPKPGRISGFRIGANSNFGMGIVQ